MIHTAATTTTTQNGNHHMNNTGPELDEILEVLVEHGFEPIDELPHDITAPQNWEAWCATEDAVIFERSSDRFIEILHRTGRHETGVTFSNTLTGRRLLDVTLRDLLNGGEQ